MAALFKDGMKAQMQIEKGKRLESKKTAMINAYALELRAAQALPGPHECTLRVSTLLVTFDTWADKKEMTRGRIKEETSRVRQELEAALKQQWQDAQARANEQQRLQALENVQQALESERSIRLAAEQQAVAEAARRVKAEQVAQSERASRNVAEARAADAGRALSAAEENAREQAARATQEAEARSAAEKKEKEASRKLNAELEQKAAMAAWLQGKAAN